jgi:hypothetical protein
MGNRIPIGPGIEEGEPCPCQGAPRAVSSGRVDFEIRAPQNAANAGKMYYCSTNLVVNLVARIITGIRIRPTIRELTEAARMLRSHTILITMVHTLEYCILDQ